ncbi:MAG TPA: glutamate 5-kinase [Erysipelothrix sp.]|nr:glutamate 5-kinase [Erysipelothrix sp.]
MRKSIKDAKRIVIKIGSSSLTHKESLDINYRKLEQLVRVLSDLKSRGKEVVLVTSGAQAVGRKALHLENIPEHLGKKQALAAIGQAKLMMTYERLFSEYNQTIAQILITKETMLNDLARNNAKNTFNELLKLNVIPIVNENDTVATHEIEFGDNDHLSSFVISLIEGDLLIILSDIDGLYTDDPGQNKNAQFVSYVDKVDNNTLAMGKDTSSSNIGTGGMSAKLDAAKIANASGAAMVLMNGKDVTKIYEVIEGEEVGTYFKPNKENNFNLKEYM